MDQARVRAATSIGAAAILLWSTLALLAAQARAIPPFELTAAAFSIAFALSLLKWIAAGQSPLRHLRQAWPVWLLGVGGLFGYHFLYFVALRHAPPVEANLINYLWPLLIVLFSALLPGERLRWFHLAGAAAGLAGTALVVTGGEIRFDPRFLAGYGAALACAATWAGYSVLSRRVSHVPTDAIGGFCGATAVLAWVCHALLEPTVWPEGGIWLALLGLGLGPVGAAFFLWDHGVKHGDIKALGAFAYATPLLSTLLLILFGVASPRWSLMIAVLLISGGAALGAGDLLVRRSTR